MHAGERPSATWIRRGIAGRTKARARQASQSLELAYLVDQMARHKNVTVAVLSLRTEAGVASAVSSSLV